MHRLMTDIETCGLHLEAPVLSLGACVFTDDTICGVYTWRLNLEKAFMLGTAKLATIVWWMNQSKEAQDHAWRGERVDQSEALTQLQDIYDTWGCEEVWSHGAPFDIPRIERLLGLCSIKVPWHYRAPRDTRTVFSMYEHRFGTEPVIDPSAAQGVSHNPGYDSHVQALMVQEAFRALRVG